MTLESALIPIPSEVTMPFAGFLSGQGILNFWLVVLLGGLGNLLGSLLAYFLGYYGQEKYVRNLIRKYGKYLLISLEEVDRATSWFKTHGELIAFGSRLLPVIRTFISLPAGFSQMNVFKFSFYSFLGALFWSAFLTFLGYLLGSNWHVLGVYFQQFDILILVGIVGIIALYVYQKTRKDKKFS